MNAAPVQVALIAGVCFCLYTDQTGAAFFFGAVFFLSLL